MKRRTRTRWMLFGLVALLGAGVLAELKREEWALPQPLTTLDANTLEQVAVECRNCRARRFEKTGGRWQMREPYDLPADDDAVARLVAIAGAPVRRRHAATEFDAKKLGLDPPVAAARLGDIRIELGTTDAINGQRYVRFGDTIALVPERYGAWLLASPESELDHHLHPPGLVLDAVRVDGAAHPELIVPWRQATTSQVRRSDGIVLDNATKRLVDLVTKDGRTIRYAVARSEGRYVALREDLPLAYTLEEAQMQHLLPR